MSANPQPCRFGWTCHRADCWFAHPTGRAIDQQQPAAPQPHAVASPYALNPALLPQYMQLLAQPQQPNFPSTVGPPPPQQYTSAITKPITSSNLNSSSSSHHTGSTPTVKRSGGGQAVCRYGRECHRDGCYFVHPEGRTIDERRGGSVGSGDGGGRASPSDDEVAEALDAFEAANGLTEEEEDEAAFRQYKAQMGAADDDDEDEFICPCCNGHPTGCTNTPLCQRGGMCACQAGRIEDGHDSRGPGRASGGGVDDTWKDEWFADSRTCDCCHGYVYRCERQQQSCAQGKCFCSASLNGTLVHQTAGV